MRTRRRARSGRRMATSIATTAPLRQEDVEPVGQRVEVLLEEPRVDQPAVQQHERLTLAALVIPGAHAGKLDITCHLAHFLSTTVPTMHAFLTARSHVPRAPSVHRV